MVAVPWNVPCPLVGGVLVIVIVVGFLLNVHQSGVLPRTTVVDILFPRVVLRQHVVQVDFVLLIAFVDNTTILGPPVVELARVNVDEDHRRRCLLLDPYKFYSMAGGCGLVGKQGSEDNTEFLLWTGRHYRGLTGMVVALLSRWLVCMHV